jgi:hypothetical protein
MNIWEINIIISRPTPQNESWSAFSLHPNYAPVNACIRAVDFFVSIHGEHLLSVVCGLGVWQNKKVPLLSGAFCG